MGNIKNPITTDKAPTGESTNEIVKVNYESEYPTVSARDLHEKLEVKTAFKDWFPRMCEYGFVEGKDFNMLKNERVQIEGTREVKREIADYELTIRCAKEICMIQRTEIGRTIRNYFLDLEDAWNAPEQVMARALQIIKVNYEKEQPTVSKKEYVIYKVTNKINGKMYIGKTYNLKRRMKQHFLDIGDGLPFHRALLKYGKENFLWEIIDDSDTQQDINEKEIFWIKKLNTCIYFKNSNGYNITIGGEGGVSWNSKPIIRFDLNGNYIDEYISCSQAAVNLGFDRKSIERACKEKYGSSNGFQWKYKEQWNGGNIGKYSKSPSIRCRKIIQLDKDGYVINIFSSVTDAANQLKIRRSNISSCLSGNVSICGGYQWIYEEEYNPMKEYRYKGIKEGNGIVQLDDDWNILNHFRNCTEAAKYLVEPEKVHKQIHKALTSRKRCRGFYWRKYDDYVKNTSPNT